MFNLLNKTKSQSTLQMSLMKSASLQKFHMYFTKPTFIVSIFEWLDMQAVGCFVCFKGLVMKIIIFMIFSIYFSHWWNLQACNMFTCLHNATYKLVDLKTWPVQLMLCIFKTCVANQLMWYFQFISILNKEDTRNCLNTTWRLTTSYMYWYKSLQVCWLL